MQGCLPDSRSQGEPLVQAVQCLLSRGPHDPISLLDVGRNLQPNIFQHPPYFEFAVKRAAVKCAGNTDSATCIASRSTVDGCTDDTRRTSLRPCLARRRIAPDRHLRRIRRTLPRPLPRPPLFQLPMHPVPFTPTCQPSEPGLPLVGAVYAPSINGPSNSPVESDRVTGLTLTNAAQHPVIQPRSDRRSRGCLNQPSALPPAEPGRLVSITSRIKSVRLRYSSRFRVSSPARRTIRPVFGSIWSTCGNSFVTVVYPELTSRFFRLILSTTVPK